MHSYRGNKLNYYNQQSLYLRYLIWASYLPIRWHICMVIAIRIWISPGIHRWGTSASKYGWHVHACAAPRDHIKSPSISISQLHSNHAWTLAGGILLVVAFTLPTYAFEFIDWWWRNTVQHHTSAATLAYVRNTTSSCLVYVRSRLSDRCQAYPLFSHRHMRTDPKSSIASILRGRLDPTDLVPG